jgi:hypothetical protein
MRKTRVSLDITAVYQRYLVSPKCGLTGTLFLVLAIEKSQPVRVAIYGKSLSSTSHWIAAVVAVSVESKPGTAAVVAAKVCELELSRKVLP